MSQQSSILAVISSTKLWTAPLKEQYLPLYMKDLCDSYAACEHAHRVFPVQVRCYYISFHTPLGTAAKITG